jgi:hypothetical protein
MTPRLLLLSAAVLAAAPAWADTLRCGSRLVVEGDTAASVRKKCGEPVNIEKQNLMRGPYLWEDNRYRYVAPGSPIEYTVEQWTFNFGPKRFMARVRLEAGIVKEVKMLGYGYR